MSAWLIISKHSSTISTMRSLLRLHRGGDDAVEHALHGHLPF